MNVERCSRLGSICSGKIPVGNDGKSAYAMMMSAQTPTRFESRPSHRDFHIHVMYFHFLIEVFFSPSSVDVFNISALSLPASRPSLFPASEGIKSCKAEKLLGGKMKNHCIHPWQHSAVIYSFLLLAFRCMIFMIQTFSPLRSSSRGAKKNDDALTWRGKN